MIFPRNNTFPRNDTFPRANAHFPRAFPRTFPRMMGFPQLVF